MNVVSLPTEERQIEFDDFWVLYPRHEAKKDARKAWERIGAEKHVEILTALAVWRTLLLAREVQFQPLPATWLRGERWEDELPKEYASRAQAHQPFQPKEDGPRSPMPEHVRQLIASLKAKRA